MIACATLPRSIGSAADASPSSLVAVRMRPLYPRMQIGRAGAMPPLSGQGGLMERRPAILAVNPELVIDDRLRQLAALDRIAGGCKRFVPRHCPHEIAVAAQI